MTEQGEARAEVETRALLERGRNMAIGIAAGSLN